MKRLKHVKDSKAFIEYSKYSNNMNDVCGSIEEYNPRNKGDVLIVFDDMIADMINNKILFCFHLTITPPSTKGCETKYYAFLHHEDSKPMRALRDCY